MNKNILILILIFGALGVVIYFLIKYIKASNEANEARMAAASATVQTQNPVTKETIVYKTVDQDLTKVLGKGSKGKEVETLQSILKNAGADLGSYGVDGDFGTKTEQALQKYFGVATASLTEIFAKQNAINDKGNVIKAGGKDMHGHQITVGLHAWTQAPEVVYMMTPKVGISNPSKKEDFTIASSGAEYRAGKNFDLGLITDVTPTEVVTVTTMPVAGGSTFMKRYFLARNTQVGVS